MDCKEAVYSEDYYDLIIEYGSIGANTSVIPADCRQEINVAYSIGYFNRERLPDLNITDYTYSAIPQCFTLMDDAALSGSGILKVQNQPTLSLKGEGILLGFLDTGIDYQNPVFQNLTGKQPHCEYLGSDDPGWQAAGGLFVWKRVSDGGDQCGASQ